MGVPAKKHIVAVCNVVLEGLWSKCQGEPLEKEDQENLASVFECLLPLDGVEKDVETAVQTLRHSLERCEEEYLDLKTDTTFLTLVCALELQQQNELLRVRVTEQMALQGQKWAELETLLSKPVVAQEQNLKKNNPVAVLTTPHSDYLHQRTGLAEYLKAAAKVAYCKMERVNHG